MGAQELGDLQRLDDRLVDLRREVATIEARRRGSADLVAARRALAERETAQRGAEAGVEEVERRAAQLRTRARTLERQLYGGSVRNPTELLTLDRELADVKARLAGEEEEELDRMGAAETAEQDTLEARQAVQVIEQRRAAEVGPDTRHLAELQERIVEAGAERDLIRSQRAAGELALYDRLATRLHPAVARLGAGDVCSGCRIAVSPREARAVRVGEAITQCPHCDRVLAR